MKPKHAPKHTHATSDFPGSIPRDTARQSPGSMLTGLEGFSPPSKNILTQQYQSSPNTPSGDLEGQILDAAQNCQETEGGGEPKEALLESSTSIDIADDRKVEEVPNPIGRQDYSDTRPAPTSIVNSFLDIGDDNIAQAAEDSEISTAAIQQEPSRGYGLSFDDLVDRLLAQSRSKLDRKFTAIFLCLYRKFATPSELVSAIIHRFQLISDSSNPQISRITSQLRYLAVLAQWVSDYPEDFAHPQTRRMVTGFVSSISSNRLFAVASKEIGISLEVVSEDDYAGWAGSHKSRSRANTVDSFLSMSSVQSTASTLNAQSSSEDILATASTDVAATLPHARSSATPSLSSSIGQSENQSTGSFQTLLNSVENAQRQAQLLTPMPRNPLSKIQWHQLMNTADEDVARELTRIDWIMFSSIRPRDLVRHVSLSGPEKDKCKSLEHVNRMIDQFNHVAFWVANLILLRDKPKHRAKMLEKFMSVAWVSIMNEHPGCLLIKIAETTSAEQLQFPRRSCRRHQWHSCSQACPDTGACSASSAEAIHATGNSYGHAKKPFCISTRLGQHIFGAYPLPTSAQARPCTCRRRKQNIPRCREYSHQLEEVRYHGRSRH